MEDTIMGGKPSTINDYDKVSARLEDSFPVLDLLQSCLSTPENLLNLKSSVLDKCSKIGGQITLRLKVIRL